MKVRLLCDGGYEGFPDDFNWDTVFSGEKWGSGVDIIVRDLVSAGLGESDDWNTLDEIWYFNEGEFYVVEESKEPMKRTTIAGNAVNKESEGLLGVLTELTNEQGLDVDNSLIKPNYKFNENVILKEFKEYLDSTYNQHYAKGRDIQTFELIAKEPERGFHFAQGNILKYADRCEHKGQTKQDLFKVMHYAVLALYCLEEE